MSYGDAPAQPTKPDSLRGPSETELQASRDRLATSFHVTNHIQRLLLVPLILPIGKLYGNYPNCLFFYFLLLLGEHWLMGSTGFRATFLWYMVCTQPCVPTSQADRPSPCMWLFTPQNSSPSLCARLLLSVPELLSAIPHVMQWHGPCSWLFF